MGFLDNIICMLVFMFLAINIGRYVKKQLLAHEETVFGLPDQCGGQENSRNQTFFDYSLASLKEVSGKFDIPATKYVDYFDTGDINTWINNGDTVSMVDNSWWHIAVDTDMTDTNGYLLRWWFNSANCSDMYRWWHPKDHVYGVWIPKGKYAASSDLVSRQGNIHRVKEYVGGKLNRLDILFKDPCIGRDCDSLKAQGVELILAGDVMAHIPAVGLVHAGELIHTLRVQGGKSILHSRFIMGRDVGCLADTWTCYVFDLLAPLVNKFMLGETQVQAIYIHCREEMYTLGRLLSRMSMSSSAYQFK